jgi:hypothetical protein
MTDNSRRTPATDREALMGQAPVDVGSDKTENKKVRLCLGKDLNSASLNAVQRNRPVELDGRSCTGNQARLFERWEEAGLGMVAVDGDRSKHGRSADQDKDELGFKSKRTMAM